MSREIKFRFWDKQNRCWSFADLYIDSDGDLYEIYEESQSYQTYMHRECVNDRYERVQYTGLRDEQGTDIYEGDVVELEHMPSSPDTETFIGQVYFKDGAFWFDDGTHEPTHLSVITYVAYHYNGYRPYRCFAKGNIYEHPELIGGGDNVSGRTST